MCNNLSVLLDPCRKVGNFSTWAREEGQTGREIECFVGINVNRVVAPASFNLEFLLVRPEEVFDDRFAVEDVDLRADLVHALLVLVDFAQQI